MYSVDKSMFYQRKLESTESILLKVQQKRLKRQREEDLISMDASSSPLNSKESGGIMDTSEKSKKVTRATPQATKMKLRDRKKKIVKPIKTPKSKKLPKTPTVPVSSRPTRESSLKAKEAIKAVALSPDLGSDIEEEMNNSNPSSPYTPLDSSNSSIEEDKENEPVISEYERKAQMMVDERLKFLASLKMDDFD